MAFHDRVIRLDLMLHFGTCSLHITKRIHKKIEHMSAGTFDNDWCNRIINDLLKWQLTTYFRKPVDPDKDGAPSYLEKVKNPIDLSTIKNKLQANEYKTANDFMQDIRLIYKNAETYNGENSMITFIAKDIVKWVEQQFSEKCNSYEEEMRFRLHKAIEELNEHMKHEPPLDINEENAHGPCEGNRACRDQNDLREERNDSEKCR